MQSWPSRVVVNSRFFQRTVPLSVPAMCSICSSPALSVFVGSNLQEDQVSELIEATAGSLDEPALVTEASIVAEHSFSTAPPVVLKTALVPVAVEASILVPAA